jgi:hypothetical protein
VPRYMIRRADTPPVLGAAWDGGGWEKAETVDVGLFHTESSDHRPRVQAKVLYDATNLYVSFAVQDAFVRATRKCHQEMVCKDSCVEFFVRPKPDLGYFNFEMNCGGTLLVHHRTVEPGKSPRESPHEVVAEELIAGMRIVAPLGHVENEIQGPVEWGVWYSVPIGLFERYVGPLGPLPGQKWSGNFYKCGDDTSHPHWASWAPIGEKLDFHQPDKFAELFFQ